MSVPYFQEVQRFRDNRWIWVLIIVFSMIALLPLTSGIYWQLYRNEPWGDNPMTDRELLLLFGFIFLSWAIAVLMILSISLDVKIDEVGVNYKFIPFKSKWRLISKEQISDYKPEKRFNFFESGGAGYHRNPFIKTRSFRIAGGKHVRIKLKNGEKILLGTQDLEGLALAMKKMMRPEQEMN